MNTQEIGDWLNARVPEAVLRVELAAIDPWIEIAPARIADVGRLLRDDPALQFNLCNCISGVDYLQTDPKKAAKSVWEPHLEVVYHLSSTVLRHLLVLKAILPRWKHDRDGELPELPSVSGVWRTADWHEREVYDLSGVNFTGHPDLRRILCPDDWQGHPLRKDYQMPLEYHGIRNR